MRIIRASTVLMLLVINAAGARPGQVVATIGVGMNPNGIAITPNGRYAYVANDNNNQITGDDTISVIDTCTNTVITTISDPSFGAPYTDQPYTITINACGTKAYVTNSDSTTVTIIDIATNTVSGVINGFDGPSGFAITPDGNTAYVNNYGGPEGLGSGNGHTVSVVNLNTNAIVATINVDLAPAALTVTPNGAYLYVANYVDGNPGTGTVQAIRTSDNTIVATIPGFSGPFPIAITPNGCSAYVTNFGSNNFAPVGTTVSVISTKTNTITATIPVGTQPAGLAITPDGKYVYISNYNTLYLVGAPYFYDLTPGVGTVNIIDTCTNKVICPTIVVGSSPAQIAITPNGAFAYVTNYSSNNVSVINILERMWLK
jgi:YVTN family beta-propeller protein